MDKLSLGQAAKITSRLLLRGRYTLSFDQIDFKLHDLSLRKRWNLFLQAGQIKLKTVNRIGIPPILQIEPTNTCNLRCLTCATGAKMVIRKPTVMPYKMFCDIMDQVKDHVCFLAFWSWGEPFVNKDAFQMIRYAKDYGILVHTSTNGHFFNTRGRARKVIESGLDSLIIAVDGLDQTTYEKYRKRGKLKHVINSIENLVAERDKVGANNPLIIFRFIVMKHNEHQIESVKKFAENLGVDVVTYRSAVVQRSEVNLEDNLAPDLKKYKQHEDQGVLDRESLIRQNSFNCNRPYANLTIFSNGDVVSCENDYNATLPLGNVSNQRLREILSSVSAASFLKGFRGNPDQYSFCKDCDLRDSTHETANVETFILNKDIYDYKTNN